MTKHYFLIEYNSPENIAGFQFTVENISRLQVESGHKFYHESDQSHRLATGATPTSINENEKDPNLTIVETTQDFQIISKQKFSDPENTQQIIECVGYYYGNNTIPATINRTSYQSLCLLEITPAADATITDNLSPTIGTNFKLVNVEGLVIPNTHLRIRNYTQTPRHLDIYLRNLPSSTPVAGFQIELDNPNNQFSDYVRNRGMVEARGFTVTGDTNTIVGFFNPSHRTPIEFQTGLLCSIAFQKPVFKDLKIKSYKLIDIDGYQINTALLDYDRERPIGTADIQGIPYIEAFIRQPNEQSPRLISALTTFNALSITLMWQTDFFYGDYDKIEIYRKVYDGPDNSIKIIEGNNDVIERDEINQYSDYNTIDNYFLYGGDYVKLTTITRDQGGAMVGTYIDDHDLKLRVHYVYAIRGIQNNNECVFSNIVMEQYCPLASLVNECPVVYLEKNTAGTTNLSEKMRYSIRVRGSWSRR